jgi:1-acyl-sn-glycerol-3-phosphate acyltransferase
MQNLDHYWRLFGTTLGFVVFGLAGLIMGLILFPLMFVFVPDRDIRKIKARKMIGKAFGAFVWMIKSLGVIDHRIDGREHIHGRQNRLIIANHPTLIDVVILISLFPQSSCVIKSAVTRNVFMRSVIGAADYISNSEPEELLASCTACLTSGASLVLFPEGTRTTLDHAIDFKPGAATVAARAGVEIIPVAIHCSPVFLNKEVPWHFVPPERPMFTIRILPPVNISELVQVEDSERRIRNDLNKALLDIIRQELDCIADDSSPQGFPQRA